AGFFGRAGLCARSSELHANFPGVQGAVVPIPGLRQTSPRVGPAKPAEVEARRRGPTSMSQQTAAFFRAEGVILSTGVMQAAAFMAAQRAGMRERVLRFGQVALSLPVVGLLGQNDRTLGNRLAYLSYRDMSEDRLAILADEYVEDILKEKILESGRELLRKAKREGHRVVLISESLQEVMTALREHLRDVDDVICNRLEYRDHKATGRL